MILRVGKVIDNVDVDKKDQLKIRVYPELKDVLEDDLPWCYPYSQNNSGSSNSSISHVIPDIGSFVRVRVLDEYWQEISYEHIGYPIDGFFDYDGIINELHIDEIESFEYPQPNFKKTMDGTIIFHDVKNGHIGLQHPSKTYAIIDKDGNVIVKAIKNVIIKNEDNSFNFEMNMNDKSFKITGGSKAEIEVDEMIIGEGSDSVARFTPLEKILKKLLTHIHVAPSGPTQPACESNLTPLSSLQSDVPNIKSEIITTD